MSGMATSPTTLWSDGVRSFVLEQKGDHYELTLRQDDRIIRREDCESEHEARDKAHSWLIALEATPDELTKTHTVTGGR